MDPLDFLSSLERLGMKFGLENMAVLCAALDQPAEAFASVIIGGTNGKGSVTAITAAALGGAGYKTGRYTSPHLERLEERFVIDGREVQTGDLREAAGTVRTAVEQLIHDSTLAGPPTFFEFATATALELFRRARVAVAVLEVGLGGRLDATNIVSPIAAAITSIALDHQAQLGDTIASIAGEKAGIIKPGIPVICGPLPPDAEDVIARTCMERAARMVRALDDVAVTARVEHGETIASVRSRMYDLADVRLALRGRHQIANAAVAISLVESLAPLGFVVPPPALRAALTDTCWPARLERVDWHGAHVLLDAAHNPAGAAALADYLREVGWSGVTLVFGAMRDKDAAGLLAPLLPLCGRLILTTPSTPRAVAAADLGPLAQRLSGAAVSIDILDDPGTALRSACEPGARVVVAGSIFLVGPLRGILR